MNTPSAPPELAVTGAAGNIGRALVRELTLAGHRVRALVRKGSELPGHPLVQRVEVDLERERTVAGALAGIRSLFLLTPFHPRQDLVQAGLVEVAVRAGVGHVVKLSALGADPAAPALVHRQHGLAEQAVIESGLVYTLLRPNAFMQNAVQWLPTVAAKDAIILPAGNSQVSMVDTRDIAAVAARALTDPVRHAGAHDLTGPKALSYAEVAAALSTVAGRPIRHLDVTPEQASAAMLGNGVPEWAVRARLELYATYRAGEAELISPAVREITGREPRDFVAFATELAGELRRDHAKT
ncbi:SDR family oxidoreductase [Crossiella sp. CA198]|uniref:SDR family oxidoreductase n=1 Tax=Crossiella sp. CA198 TaxID=3455607 RepID=UPI003F8D6EBF